MTSEDCKICIDCKENKPLKSFGKCKRQLGGLRSECKLCRSIYDKAIRKGDLDYKVRKAAYNKQWKKDNPEKVKLLQERYNKRNPFANRAAIIKNKFNMSSEDYENMLLDQKGSCKICKRQSNNKSQKHFHIDHCHETGKIRGLLCNKCNMGLGMFNDNIELLKIAIDYLGDK